MRPNRWMFTLPLVALLAAAGTNHVQAQGGPGRPQADRPSDRPGADGPRRGPGGPHGPGGPAGGRFGGGRFGGADLPLRQLDVSDAQRQQIRAILDKAREEARPSAERLRTAAEARRTAMEAVPVNEGQIRQTTQALAAAEAEVAIARAHARADVLAQLTPDQQQKLRQLQQSRRAGDPRDGADRRGRQGR